MYIISNRLKSGIYVNAILKGPIPSVSVFSFHSVHQKPISLRVDFYCETTSFTLSSRRFKQIL